MIFSVEQVDWSESRSQLMTVRTAVFVIEQQIPAELEEDEWDIASQHVLITTEGRPLATGRLLLDGHIGRVAVLQECRGQGLGILVMNKLMEIAQVDGHRQLALSAQVQVSEFYSKLGFVEKGGVYQEAGIGHILMSKNI